MPNQYVAEATARNAYATLVTSENYVVGALVLARALRATGTPHALVVMHSALSGDAVDALRTCFDEVVAVESLRSAETENLRLLGRPDLDVTYTKLNAWTLTHYAKVVFLDADTLPLQNIDDLFDREELSAAPDCGWPDIFNSGVFVLRPSLETYARLVAFSRTRGSWDGGDQGLLNEFFSDWAITPGRRLPFTYNVTPTSVYTYAPAFQRFQADIKVVHFAGPTKPWQYSRLSDGTPVGKNIGGGRATNDVLLSMVAKWWQVYNANESQWAHMLGRSSRFSNYRGSHAHAGHEHFTRSYSGPAATRSGSPFGEMSSLRYAWPDHEMDHDHLASVYSQMGTGSARRLSLQFRRRNSSGGQSQPLGFTLAHPNDASPTGMLKSPRSPAYQGLVDNFSDSQPQVAPSALSQPQVASTASSASVMSSTLLYTDGPAVQASKPPQAAAATQPAPAKKPSSPAQQPAQPQPQQATKTAAAPDQAPPKPSPAPTQPASKPSPAPAQAATKAPAAPTQSATKSSGAPAEAQVSSKSAPAASSQSKSAAAAGSTQKPQATTTVTQPEVATTKISSKTAPAAAPSKQQQPAPTTADKKPQQADPATTAAKSFAAAPLANTKGSMKMPVKVLGTLCVCFAVLVYVAPPLLNSMT